MNFDELRARTGGSGISVTSLAALAPPSEAEVSRWWKREGDGLESPRKG